MVYLVGAGAGGNLRLHPADALQRYDKLKSLAALKRNAAHC